MGANKLSVVVSGGEPKEPLVNKCTGKVSKALMKHLPEMDANTPILIHAQVGSGKTYAIVHVLLPWALEHGKKILYVSSRVALNTQTKREIIKVTGQSYLMDQHTEKGMRAQEDFEGITVTTYHRLYSLMMFDPTRLKEFDILVFDEIHALLDDAEFVPYTGFVLNNIKTIFGGKLRIYMSATPQNILHELMKAESPYQLTILRFPRNFSYVRLAFFHDENEIIRRINDEKSSQKWLIYTPSISHGECLKSKLNCPVRLLNSVVREEDENAWEKILLNQAFEEKVAIATAVIDAGVNLVDKSLVNVVVFGASITSAIQVLGRKRLQGSEIVRLFVWCPTMQDVCQLLHKNNSLQEAVHLYGENPGDFEEHYILRPQQYDLRNYLRVDCTGNIHLNSLVKEKLKVECEFLKKLLKRAKNTNKDCGYDRILANALNLTGLNIQRLWLDNTRNGKARAELDQLISAAVGTEMSENEFEVFSKGFSTLYVAIFGMGKGGADRNDRLWKESKINKKLLELGFAYHFNYDKTGKKYELQEDEHLLEKEEL